MPTVSVSMVCESTAANVTAALRESLGSSGAGSNTSCSATANAATGNAADAAAATGISSAALMTNGHSADIDDSDSLQSKLVASAKRVLLSKIDYEEVDSYGQTVLDTLKSKYIVLKPFATVASINNAVVANGSNGSSNGCTTENGRSSYNAATCNNSNSYVSGSGGNSSNHNSANVHNGVNGSAAECNGDSNTINKSSAPTTTTTTSTVSSTILGTSNKNANASNSIVTSNAPTPNANIGASAPIRRPNSHELPLPKRVLFPRENVRIGWKNGTLKWQIGVGMMNVGNTCYLNSTLQALFHVPSMANWLASETLHMERCDDGGDAGCIICAMCKTLLMAQKHIAPIRPYSVYSKLRIICKHLIMGRQEDAHEFLRYLVEAMEKSYLARFHNNKELDQYSKETTPLNQILGGYLKSAVRCLSCNHVSVTFQHFQDLLLDIRKADTVEEALDAYFSRERLEDMGYKCESCKKKVSATKQFTLERAPIALCIQLKRFSMMGSKLNKQIAIRPRLDLSKYLSKKNPNEQYTYKLVSMITHLGASQHCGHYTAIGLTESGAYYNFDDSSVRPISVQGVCNTNAYIIFYEMDNAPAVLPRTPTQSNTLPSTLLKENNTNFQPKTNGFSVSVKNNKIGENIGGSQQSAQRLIGPQLPPGGLQNNNAITSTACNGIKLKNVLSQCASSITTTTTTTNTGTTMATNNPKILIHFKNGPAILRSSANSTTMMSPSPKPTVSTNLDRILANGVTNGTAGSFQDQAHSKPTLNNSPSSCSVEICNTLVKVSMANENSCSSEPEDGVSSTTDGYSECTVLEAEASSLPSMPNLFDDDESKSKDHCPELVHATFSDNSNSNGNSNKSNKIGNKTSLVPYDLESDDDNMWHIATKRQENQSPALEQRERSSNSFNGSNNNKALKRSSSVSQLDISNDHSNDSNFKSKKSNDSQGSSPNIDSTIRMNSAQSKIKPKTDNNPIDEIFNNINNHKATKRKSQSPAEFTLPLSQMPRSPLQIGYDDKIDDPDGNCIDNDKYEPNVTPPCTPHMRAYATPSPPLIQTKTGFWQVTSINADSTKGNAPSALASTNQKPISRTTPPIPLTSPRTWINPFSDKSLEKKTPTQQPISRPSVNDKSAHLGNVNKLDVMVDTSSFNGSTTSKYEAISELVHQSHRGYGEPVRTWSGDQPDIEKEIKNESREQRQNDIEDDEENEMDRGRQKKVKHHVAKDCSYERTPGYNPFQEQDNQRCRWKSNNGSMNLNNTNGNNSNNSSNGNGNGNVNSNGNNNPYRYYGANYRQQPYQRNKSKFQRYNYNKYQRPQQQNNGSNGYSNNGNSNNNNSNSHNNNYNGRRET